MTLSIVCRAYLPISSDWGKEDPPPGVASKVTNGWKGIAPSDCAGSGDGRSVVAEGHPLCQDNPHPPSPAAGTGGM